MNPVAIYHGKTTLYDEVYVKPIVDLDDKSEIKLSVSPRRMEMISNMPTYDVTLKLSIPFEPKICIEESE